MILDIVCAGLQSYVTYENECHLCICFWVIFFELGYQYDTAVIDYNTMSNTGL